MKKAIILLIIILLIITFIKTINKTNDTSKEVINSFEEEEKDNKIDEMSLEEKIGQLLIISYRKDDIKEKLPTILEEVKPGGFILFSENITTYDDTINLIKSIKNSNDIPLFIGIDEEGGNVQRLKNLKDYKTSDIPYMSYVKTINDAYNLGKVIAEELRVFGINLDFAQV